VAVRRASQAVVAYFMQLHPAANSQAEAVRRTQSHYYGCVAR